MSFSERPPPSTAAIAIASAIVAGTVGYFLGQGKALGLFGGSPTVPSLRDEHGLEPDEEEDTDEEEDEKQHGLKDWEGIEECKLVLVVRTDLGMTKGKIAAQCSHATLACYKSLLCEPSSTVLKRWERYGQAKVATQVKSEEELEILQAQAVSLGLCAQIIHDAGRTQIQAGSATVLGVGPGPKSIVDQVTGGLKLL